MNVNWVFCRNQQADSELPMEPQGTESQQNVERLCFTISKLLTKL
jgi:hypothetical protein